MAVRSAPCLDFGPRGVIRIVTFGNTDSALEPRALRAPGSVALEELAALIRSASFFAQVVPSKIFLLPDESL
jgi:hypothetical protein